MENLISVIIPIYKVEKYLDQCIESIVNQTYRNLEIILVDDGSPDNCPKMCDEWALKDKRIKVIHKQNGGLSDARNAGMKVAKGECVSFIDSDDWIEQDMFSILMNKMDENNCDIAACGVRKVWDSKNETVLLTNNKEKILNNHQAMIAILEEKDLKQPVWYKLYKKELIQDILFEVGKYHEDVFWSYQAIGRANNIYLSKYIGYNYRQRKESIMGDSFSIRRLDALEAKKRRIEYIEERYPDLLCLAVKNMLFSCMYMMQCSLKSNSGKSNKINTIIKGYFTDTLRYKNILHMTLKEKIWINFSGINLNITCRIRNFLKIGI